MEKTIKDFGIQWKRYRNNTGFYASVDALGGLIQPLLDLKDIQGRHVADVGAGSGRYTRLFHECGASRILALEPSEAFAVLTHNTRDLDRIDYLQTTAEKIPASGFDLVFCIGVLQFIADPAQALEAMGKALKPGGRIFLWVYGEENNGLYLSFLKPLRFLSRRLPTDVLDLLADLLVIPAGLYARIAGRIRLPLSDYMINYYGKLDRYSKKLVIFDQLNPKDVVYYRREDLERLMRDAGFTDIRVHHRYGYSWSVVGRYAV